MTDISTKLRETNQTLEARDRVIHMTNGGRFRPYRIARNAVQGRFDGLHSIGNKTYETIEEAVAVALSR